MTQIDKLLVNFTARALNADEVGLDCRAAFEQEYQGYYLVRDQGGMYKSEETGILWNCWWGAWEKAWNTRHAYEAAKPKGEWHLMQACTDVGKSTLVRFVDTFSSLAECEKAQKDLSSKYSGLFCKRQPSQEEL